MYFIRRKIEHSSSILYEKVSRYTQVFFASIVALTIFEHNSLIKILQFAFIKMRLHLS